LFTSRVMMTLPSGVIWGLTLRARLALRNEVDVPDALVVWYGISVPDSISASTLLVVSTRGFEMILPFPSFSSAEISRLMKRVCIPLNRLMANVPGLPVVLPEIGRLTLVALPAIHALKARHRGDKLILLTDKHPDKSYVSSWDILGPTGWFEEGIFYEPGPLYWLNLKAVLATISSIRRIRAGVAYILAPERNAWQFHIRRSRSRS